MNPVPFLWLAAVVGFLLLEASTFSMTSVWFAVGAAVALLTCLFTGSFRVQALVFIVVSALCLLMFRPLAAKRSHQWRPQPWPGGHRADHRHRRPAGPCAAGRRGLECPLCHSRRHPHPRAALPCDRTAQHPAHRGARIDRKPQSVICVLR